MTLFKQTLARIQPPFQFYCFCISQILFFNEFALWLSEIYFYYYRCGLQTLQTQDTLDPGQFSSS